MKREAMSRIPVDPVLYEIYVRSFSDSNADGVGDLLGVTSKLDYLAELGVDGIWLTPIFESPQFDFGYDVSDYYRIFPEYGTLRDFDLLVAEAHQRGIAVILDMILGHTSKAHPWYRERPDMYIWADKVPNNWVSAFGGSAWSRDGETGRHYYHRYYPEQPSLNWANPLVRGSMHEVIRFWVDRGVDGFRLDALDGIAVDSLLRDEPAADPALLAGRDKDGWADYWKLQHIYTTNQPQVLEELRELVRAFPDASFVVEADLPTKALPPYTDIADSSFAFDFLRAPLNGKVIAGIIAGAGIRGNLAWALSNHDQPRLVSRWGRDLAGVAAVLLLTLPGWSFIYQGDEIGMVDGKGGPVTYDRSGRDAVRHPMQWSAAGGFSAGVPWLPYTDPVRCNAADQRNVPGSMLELYKDLIRLRRKLSGPVKVLTSSPDGISFRRGDHLIDINLAGESRPAAGSPGSQVVLSTRPLTEDGRLPARSATIRLRPQS